MTTKSFPKHMNYIGVVRRADGTKMLAYNRYQVRSSVFSHEQDAEDWVWALVEPNHGIYVGTVFGTTKKAELVRHCAKHSSLVGAVGEKCPHCKKIIPKVK